MPLIKAFNDFLSEDELERATKVISENAWIYGGISNIETENDTKFFMMKLGDEPLFTDTIFNKIKEVTGIPELKIERVYANGQTPGLDGSYHTDSTRHGCYTFLLYLSDITEDNVDEIRGHTEFKINNKVFAVEPIKNKGIFFKSDILHRGMGPSIRSNILRITLAYKLYT